MQLVPSPDHCITTTTAPVGPPGITAKPNSVDARGHSGADHPPSADEVGLGVSFGQVPLQSTTEPRGPRSIVAGADTFLSTVVRCVQGDSATGKASLSIPATASREQGSDNNADPETSEEASDSHHYEGSSAFKLAEARAGGVSQVDSITGSPEDSSPGTLHARIESEVRTITGLTDDQIPAEFGSWAAATEGCATGRSPGHSTGGFPEE